MVGKFKRFVNRLNDIHNQSKRNRIAILYDFISLKRKLRISFYEYYKFNLESEPFLRSTFLSALNKKLFLEHVNPRKYFVLARNKYLTHLLLGQHGVNKSELFCYYNPISRNTNLVAKDILAVFKLLLAKDVKQCVIKTTESSHGEGVVVVKAMNYLKDDIELFRYDNKTVLLSELLKDEPLIFESLVIQTNQMAELNISSVNTVRIMTALHPNGEAEVFGAFLKVGRDGSCVDNAGNGGNVCAKVDINTGKVSRVINFNGWRQWEFVTNHPDSQSLLEGIVIENWDNICAKLIGYQKSVPYLKALGWDVAITDKGPLIIEMNDYWDETGQLFIGDGWLEKLIELDKEWRNEY